ncbi:MAG: glutathione peroxidase [Treponema sp.]|nr:glutathione peroxidase [Treponema sp.]
MQETIFSFSAERNDGTKINLSQYKGNVILVVNTASKCSFTPQYKGLQALYEKYRDKGFMVLGFPCDQFAHQEPGSDAEIAQFCEVNYGVTFPLMKKIEVNGSGAHPLFVWLRSKAHGVIGDSIKWNFTKFLVSRDGQTVKRFAPTVEPEKLEADIEAFLAK